MAVAYAATHNPMKNSYVIPYWKGADYPMTFKPGQSGNPAGSKPRPKLDAMDLANIRASYEFTLNKEDIEIVKVCNQAQQIEWPIWQVSQENEPQDGKA